MPALLRDLLDAPPLPYRDAALGIVLLCRPPGEAEEIVRQGRGPDAAGNPESTLFCTCLDGDAGGNPNEKAEALGSGPFIYSRQPTPCWLSPV